MVLLSIFNLFDEVDARLQVKAKVDELPIDALLAVLLLFEHEHVVIEELLESLVGVVDAQLLKGVQLIWIFFWGGGEGEMK